MTVPKPFLRVAMLVDEWFPSVGRGIGSFGGTQVHVRQLKHYLETDHQAQVVLFYQSHQHLFLKLLWPVLAFVDLILYNRYHRLSLIHVHGPGCALSAKLAGRILGIPVIFTVHNHSHLEEKSPKSAYWYERFILTQIGYDHQITVSKSFLNYPNVNQPVTVIPNGVDVRAYDRIKTPKNPQPTLIWVGKDDPTKGLDILKKAIVKVRKSLPGLQTELVTHGRLQGQALIKAYKQAHVFVLPSLVESQPITLLEAWAAGLPVVVTDVGDNKLMVDHGVSGYIVEPGNAQQLAHYILKVLRARKSADRLAAAGYAWVKNHYSWKQVGRETFRLYRQTINHFSQPASDSDYKFKSGTELTSHA